MMKYLVILLSDQSTSFCYCDASNKEEGRLISIENLRNAIKYAYMEDLYIQFVLPDYQLPDEYDDIITSTKATIIAPLGTKYNADVLVIDGMSAFNDLNIIKDSCYILRTRIGEFFTNYKDVINRIREFTRLNIVFTDIEDLTDEHFSLYQNILSEFVDYIKDIILSGDTIQLNILTDRLVKDAMNNCNAGSTTITLAPNGQFYICPAFYYVDDTPIGDLENGIVIKNQQLYKLQYAPLCRDCDAYQCKRCVFLNKKLTREVNIPSREQCVISHIERNASRTLLHAIREHIIYLPTTSIKEITYLDPFDNIKK